MSGNPRILYGIGVGPGDPELLTVKAARILGGLDTVFCAASSRNESSSALDVASRYLKPGAKIERLDFPMTMDVNVLEQAWEDNADKVLQTLEHADAGFLTLGDPTLYSTFGYLRKTLNKRGKKIRMEIIPGIASYQAAAARQGIELAEGGQSLTILSGISDPARLTEVLKTSDNAVILKSYRALPALKQVISELGLTEKSFMVSRLGMEGEEVFENLDDCPEIPSYFSLIVVKKA